MTSSTSVLPAVACVGDVFVDRVAHLERMPAAGEGSWASPLQDFGGGTSGNVAADLGSLAIPVSIVARVGDDPVGETAALQLREAGVDTSRLVVDPRAPSGEVIIFVDATGERTILPCTLGGAYTKLTTADLEHLVTDPVPMVFLTGCALGDEPIGSAMVDLAVHLPSSTRVYFDPNLRIPPDAVTPELRCRFQTVAARADVVLAGQDEVDALELRQRPGQDFVVKQGSLGAVLHSADGREHSAPAHEVDVVDAIGAGDCFDAGYIAAEAHGYKPAQALAIANAAGAWAVTRSGARVQPDWETVLSMATTQLVRN